jgi:hypothetical protein
MENPKAARYLNWHNLIFVILIFPVGMWDFAITMLGLGLTILWNIFLFGSIVGVVLVLLVEPWLFLLPLSVLQPLFITMELEVNDEE